jgi:hypothetical protein
MSKIIEVESCYGCKFNAFYNDVKGDVCKLGDFQMPTSWPNTPPPANCPLREGEVTVRLKGTEPDYKAEVLKVYPDAVIRQTPLNIKLGLVSGHKWIVDKPVRGEINLWKRAYEHIKNNAK